MIRSALQQGIGIAQTPRPFVEDLIRSGELEVCLPQYAPPPHRMFAMLPQQRTMPPKVRAFIDFIAGLCDPQS
jgi:LysR family transcriptional regulator, regulator for bpeEF and oprC